jgi:hypothetical protein
MVHGLPSYYTILGFTLDLGNLPAEVVAFLAALDAAPEPVDFAPPMRGTQDSVYEDGNPAVHP